MGMYAQYLIVNSTELDSLLNASEDEFDELLFELQENQDAEVAELDKLWDVLHYFLTGVSALTPIENDPLSELIVGKQLFSDDPNAEFISYTKSEDIATIISAYKKINWDVLTEKFMIKNAAENDLYPSGITDNKTELLHEMRGELNELLVFYQSAVNCDKHVIVNIA